MHTSTIQKKLIRITTTGEEMTIMVKVEVEAVVVEPGSKVKVEVDLTIIIVGKTTTLSLISK
jgi:hypothetical protein